MSSEIKSSEPHPSRQKDTILSRSLKMSIYRHDPAAVSGAHALSQGPSISALLRVGASTPFKGKATEQAIAAISTPGELISVELPPVGCWQITPPCFPSFPPRRKCCGRSEPYIHRSRAASWTGMRAGQGAARARWCRPTCFRSGRFHL